MSKTPQVFNPDRLTREQELALIQIGIAAIIQRTLVNGARLMFPDPPTRKPRTLTDASRQKMAAKARANWAKRKAAAKAAARTRKGATDGQR